MGSEFRGEIFKERTARVLKQWHSEVRDRRKQRELVLLQSSPAAPSDTNPNRAPASELVVAVNYVSRITEITEEKDEESLS